MSENDFARFFRAVHGCEPFPWQRRLSMQVASSGWPSLLDLPTGSGKTAALDIAVFALALGVSRPPRRDPLRVVYVVDRRTIVDQAFERAQRIRDALRDSTDDTLRRVRDRLAAKTHDGVPLRVAMLGGGIARDDVWARTPDQPLIVVSTVDQVGSRLLFRGYGLTDSMRPVHAALLGCDALYLLDEVHLSQPFKETLTAIRDRYRHWAEDPLPAPLAVVEMSATPGARRADVVGLTSEDRGHAELSTRLRAAKPTRLTGVPAKSFVSEMVRQTLACLEPPGQAVCAVVNRVGTARELYEALRERLQAKAALHLLTGRMRPIERERVEREIVSRVHAGRIRGESDEPVVVVATQTIEACADFDFDALVSECASLDALRQRFGRLDRLGHLAGAARGAIVARTDAFMDDPVYGDTIGNTWSWLAQRGEVVDFGIDALAVPLDAAELGLVAPIDHAPVLLPAHLDAWVQTSPVPDPEPDVSLWLHGPQRSVADVQVVWRADLSEALLTRAVGKDDGQEEMSAREMALGLVEAMPPVSMEAMSVPFPAVLSWLKTQGERDVFDVEGARTDDEREEPTRSTRPAIVWRGEQSDVVGAEAIRPGQTIVVPAEYGGIGPHGTWSPTSHESVADVAERARWRLRRRPMIRLHPVVAPNLLGGVDVPAPASVEGEERSDEERVLEWLNGLDVSALDGECAGLFEHLRRHRAALRVERVPSDTNGATAEYFHLSGAAAAASDDAADGAVTEDSRSSFTGARVPLSRHCAGVAQRAVGFAERLGLPDRLVADIRLAGEWHDAGKADIRFQRWLHGGSEFKALVQSEPLAKGATRLASRAALRRARERAGYPAKGRHELMSLALMRAAAEAWRVHAGDPVLIEHLVASHHGYCRPLAPYVPDPAPVEVVFAQGGISARALSAHRLERLDSGVPDGFWRMVRRYGWWGLALLETCLRLADHRQSEYEQSPEAAHG